MYLQRKIDVRSLSNDIPVLETTDFSQSDDIYSYAKAFGLSEPAAFRAGTNEKYTTVYTELLQNTNDKLGSVLFSSERNQMELKNRKPFWKIFFLNHSSI